MPHLCERRKHGVKKKATKNMLKCLKRCRVGGSRYPYQSIRVKSGADYPQIIVAISTIMASNSSSVVNMVYGPSWSP